MTWQANAPNSAEGGVGSRARRDALHKFDVYRAKSATDFGYK